MITFASLLKKLKPEYMSWSELAERIGASAAYVSLLAADKRRPSLEQIEKIAKILGADRLQLELAASYVPKDLLRILVAYPHEAREALLQLEARMGSGPSPITTEPVEKKNLTWKAELRKALLPSLRKTLDRRFSAPWNTSRHQVLVLPGYRIYNAKFYYARFDPSSSDLRYGFWIEKGIEEGDVREPYWKMNQSWDWHRFIQWLHAGKIRAKDLGLDIDGVEVKATVTDSKTVSWTKGSKKALLRRDSETSREVGMEDLRRELTEWPKTEWCNVFIGRSMNLDEVLERPQEGVAPMVELFEALFPLLSGVVGDEGNGKPDSD